MSGVTPPTLTELTFPSPVDLSGGPQSVMFSLSATDPAGLGSSTIFFEHPITLVNSDGTTISVPGININGTSATWTISPLTPIETDPISDLALIDKVGNRSDYTSSQLAALGLPNAIMFTQGDSTPPTLVSDNPLAVDIGATATITSNLLAAIDSNNSNAQLTYTVINGPSFGTLLKNGSATSSFTQADIDNGLITYHEATSNVSSDFFRFFVSDPTQQHNHCTVSNPNQPTDGSEPTAACRHYRRHGFAPLRRQLRNLRHWQ
jgi:hypothetical protein